jgi:hypothetical protein
MKDFVLSHNVVVLHPARALLALRLRVLKKLSNLRCNHNYVLLVMTMIFSV